VSSRARFQPVCVVAELSVDDVGQPPFEASHRFLVALAVGSLPQVIGSARGVLPDLGEGHDVEAEVELTITCTRKPMADGISGGHINRSCTGVGGERGGGTETIDRADPAEYLAGGQRADTAQVGQRGAGFGDCSLYVGGGFGDAAVQLTDLSDEVRREPAQCSTGGIAGANPAFRRFSY
jgi:hypothetical protein